MDAKELLEYIARYPPQPFAGGCAKIALRRLLRTLQIVGAYHEHRYYAQYNDSKQILGRHYMEVVDSQHDDVMVYTASQGVPDMFTYDPTTLVPQGKLFVRRQPDPIIAGNNAMTLKQLGQDIRRRDTVVTTDKDLLSIANNETLTVNNKETGFQPVPVAVYASSDSFLGRCGIVDKHLTRQVITSLGYDILLMDDVKDNSEIKHTSPWSMGSCLKNLWSDRTYAFIFLLVHWANFLRCAMYINHESHVPLTTALIPVLWFFMVASCNTSMFVSCVRRDHFYKFFKNWTTIFRDPTSRVLGLRGVLHHTFITSAVVVQWVVTFTNVACIAFLMMMQDDFSAGMNYIFYLTGYRSTTVIVVSAIIVFFTSATWIGTTTFIVILCRHVQIHFREFNQVLHLHIAAAGSEFPQSLTLLRERHLAMCDNVAVLDRYISVTVGLAFSVFITLACLLIYQVFKVPMDGSVMAITVFWLMNSFFLVSIITYSMADVNVAMHAVSDDLYAIQTRHMTLEQFVQLQMFLAKVNGPSMGFTILGLVVVTRELMLTLFGIYLTYGIVLLQFP